jgi:hypothetical protein
MTPRILDDLGRVRPSARLTHLIVQLIPQSRRAATSALSNPKGTKTMGPVETASNGRLVNGRFAQGNTLAKGNPHARRMHDLRRALLDSVDSQTVQDVTQKLADLARGGDVQAAKLLLEYVVGEPVQSVELSGPEGEPLGIDFGSVQNALLNALAPFPEARVQVAMMLRGLADDRLPDTSRPACDGPRPGGDDGSRGA